MGAACDDHPARHSHGRNTPAGTGAPMAKLDPPAPKGRSLVTTALPFP